MMARGREPEVRELLHDLVVWCSQRADVRAVALVGSWARDDARYDSDVDVVLLTTDRAGISHREPHDRHHDHAMQTPFRRVSV